MKFLNIVVLFLLILPSVAFSQEQEVIPITRITDPIILDGLSNESAWEDVKPFPMVMHEPIFSAEPTEKTVMLAAYDDDYIYFAMRGFDSNPEGIRRNVLIRDRFGSDDYFEVMIDSFSTNARFRYNFSEGNDLWIVYNEDLNTNARPYMLPEMPRSRFRAFMVKYTHTFII